MGQEAMSVFVTNLGRYNEGDLVGGWQGPEACCLARADKYGYR